MRFANPEWFLLIPIFLFLAWYWPQLGLRKPLRAIAALLLVLMLARPQVQSMQDGLDLWVLVDRSVSSSAQMTSRFPEMRSVLERSKGRKDRTFYVDFADVALLQEQGDGFLSERELQATKLRLATRYALSNIPEDRMARILVLTDGYSTEPLSDLSERLIEQQVPMDYRLLVPPVEGDYRVERIVTPTRVQPGEPFLLQLEFSGNQDGTIPFEVSRNGKKLMESEVEVTEGKATLYLTDRLAQPGAHRFDVRIRPDKDAFSGNNTSETWIEVASGPRILLVTRYENDPLSEVLRRQGFEVDQVTDFKALGPGNLAGSKVCILNDVPAHLLPAEFLRSVDFFVRYQGGGFLMTGGKFSFGSGGYFQSSIDKLLPVSMELRQEHRKLSVALAIVVDRSGSMSASAGGGMAGGITKMDLANNGAAQAIAHLGPSDAITVFYVDSTPHVVTKLVQIGPNPSSLQSKIRKMKSMGGGIYVYNGMKAAWAELKKAKMGIRHMILFSDAADSEQPGQYKKLIDEMVKEDVTVSVIGLGRDTDSDAAFLQDIANRGKGRIFFTTNAQDIPSLFVQETVAIARSAFLNDPVKLVPSAGWLELSSNPMEWLGQIDGYNLSYLRDGASVAAVSGDEYEAPLVAFWQRGAGRTGALSFPVGGDFSKSVRSWPKYGDFLQTKVRWLMGETTPPGVGVRTRVEGSELKIDLLFDDTWTERLVDQSPRISIVDGVQGSVDELIWERLQPGHFQARMQLESDRWIRGAVQMGKSVIPFGPVSVGTNPEWAFNRDRLEELMAVSRISGGEERVDLASVWSAPRIPRFQEISLILLITFMLVMLLDALESRWGGLPWVSGLIRRQS